MINFKEAAIYWFRLPEHDDFYTQGYLGVSKDPPSRFRDHLKQLQANKHKNPHLVHAFKKYGWDSIVKEVIFYGEETHCYEIEHKFRSIRGIGWNIAIGGHRGPGWPKGKKWSEEAKKKFSELRKQKTKERLIQKQLEKEKLLFKKQQDKEHKKQKQLEDKKRIQKEKLDQKLAKKQELVVQLQKNKDIAAYEKAQSTLRPFCKSCGIALCEINYTTKTGKIHYRSKCHQCSRLNIPHKKQKPRWTSAGYVKKTICERCGFKSKSPVQLLVFHTDGNLNNLLPVNLKTICLNCCYDPKFRQLGWRQGDLIPDY